MDISGVLYKKSPLQSGTGKLGTNWTKIDFVVDIKDERGESKKLAFTAWNERATLVDRLNIGEQIAVNFDISSREYNSRWYTDLTARKIDVLGEGAYSSVQTPAQQSPTQGEALTNGLTPSAPLPGSENTESSDFSDDLPF